MRSPTTPAISAALFTLALLPRALAGRFLTVDEAYHWIGRVERFLAALRAGDLAGTYQVGHPGVTALWLGTLGQLAYEWLTATGRIAADPDALRALLRLPVAAATALAVALAFPLLRRLLGARVALLAALLWAGEPFLVAHSQLLHLDALLTSLMTLSLLLALQTLSPQTRRSARWWVASGALGGLALLTKSPAVTLLPFVALVALLAARRAQPGWLPAARRSLPPLLLWCAAAAAVWVALWPAAWVDPLGALGRVVTQAEADGGSPHGWGNFFLGRAVADPGPLFYPVTLAFRLAPWTLLGLLAGAALLLPRLRPSPREAPELPLALLLLFAVGFVAIMSVPPKKFDRYALPAYPAIAAVAAWGLVEAAGALRRRTWIAPPTGATAGSHLQAAGAWLLLVGALGANLALSHPYHLAYFSPLLGGGPAAARVVPVGWGEGYELAGDWIAAQPNGADRPTAARYEPVLAPFVPAGAAPLARWQQPGAVDYAVVYIDQIQRADKPETFEALLAGPPPAHTVRINGIEYAYVYQIAPPVAEPLGAQFGDGLRLRGYALESATARATGALTLTLEWEAIGQPERDYMLFVHLLRADGERVTQVDVPPGGGRWPTSAWRPGGFVSTAQRVPLPADLPAGDYRLAVGVYDPATLARLPLRGAAGDAADGADALLLPAFRLP